MTAQLKKNRILHLYGLMDGTVDAQPSDQRWSSVWTSSDRSTSNLWVPVIRFMSCDLRVLMDQPTKAIPSGNPPRRRHGNGHAELERRRLPQRAVRAVAVVMVDILGQHRPQLPTAHDQHPV
jgi:hypothetical protein